jgi:hypothetical protein
VRVEIPTLFKSSVEFFLPYFSAPSTVISGKRPGGMILVSKSLIED